MTERPTQVLCCAECHKPVLTTPRRGSYCFHCDYAPSMQDTYLGAAPAPKQDTDEQGWRRCEVCGGPGPTLYDETPGAKNFARYCCKKCHSTPDTCAWRLTTCRH